MCPSLTYATAGLTDSVCSAVSPTSMTVSSWARQGRSRRPSNDGKHESRRPSAAVPHGVGRDHHVAGPRISHRHSDNDHVHGTYRAPSRLTERRDAAIDGHRQCRRPGGLIRQQINDRIGDFDRIHRIFGVSTGPGCTVLTRIRCLPSSAAKVLPIPVTPNFDAVQGRLNGPPLSPLPEEMSRSTRRCRRQPRPARSLSRCSTPRRG